MAKINVQKNIIKTVLLRKFSDTIFKIYGVKINDSFIFYYDIFLNKNLKFFLWILYGEFRRHF